LPFEICHLSLLASYSGNDKRQISNGKSAKILLDRLDLPPVIGSGWRGFDHFRAGQFQKGE
jgi:hypothetical protein